MGSISLIYLSLEDVRGSSSSFTYLTLIISGVLLTKLLTISYLPETNINNWVIKDHPHRSIGTDGINQFVYPLSVPIEEGLSDYRYILPSVPRGQKIVTVVFDAFREDYFGKTLEGISLTPNMSKFALNHHYFSNYYVQSNWTKPSVASFFTGQYLHEHKTFEGTGQARLGENNKITQPSYSGHVLPGSARTLAERLKQRGFKNAAYVSIPHIGSSFQFGQGFDQYETSQLRELREVYFSFRSILFWLLREQTSRSFIYLHLQGPHSTRITGDGPSSIQYGTSKNTGRFPTSIS
ncbi:MAG: sulfatase-like hydrolase/transferase [bacterium]